MPPLPPGAVRIGEFSRRVGVSPELLRAWERRYGLVRPVRSEGGFRLYTAEDGERVARMRSALADGLSAAEAARSALTDTHAPDEPLADAHRRLREAVASYDEPALHAVVDDALAAFGVETALRGLLLPALHRIGEEWERGELEVAQEHFASTLLRERLLNLARVWGRGGGPRAILACAPGERHDIGLIAFGLLLRSHGARILFLGADTPLESVGRAAAALAPRLVVLSSVDAGLLEAQAPALRRLAKRVPLALGGPGATETLCRRLGVRRLGDDVGSAAESAAALL